MPKLRIFAIVNCALFVIHSAFAAETVSVESIQPGAYEHKLADGSVFAYRLETEDPIKPGIEFHITQADPTRVIDLVIPRRDWWRHADVSSGENWVECVREGTKYRITRTFRSGETLSFKYEFDPDALPGAKPRADADKVWTVDFGDGAPVHFALDDDCMVNLERFRPVHAAMATATVSRVVCCDKSECRVYGIAADWWFTAFLNGREVYTTWPDGNGTDLKSPYGHILRLDMEKGKNKLEFRITPGCDSWDFLCREFPSYDNWPKSEADRKKSFDVLFPVQAELKYGPWVTAVSSDRARIGVELTAEGLVGIRYSASGGRKLEKWTTVYGQKDYRKVHLFELEGLMSATSYDYEIVMLDERSNNESVIAKGTFETYPSVGGKCDFYLLGDTQFDEAGRKAVIDRLLGLGLAKGKFIVSVGDVGNSFDDFPAVYQESFCEYFKGRGVTLPTVLVRGNHEFHGRHTTDFPKYFGRPYYSFTYGDTFFFVIDTGEWAKMPRMEMASYCAEQAAWLANEIATPACKSAKRHVMLAHTVPFEGEGVARANVVAGICADVFYGEHPKCRLDLWLCGDIHAAYRYDPISRKIAGRARVTGAPRPTEKDFENIRFPVYVNDGPNAGRAKQTMTHVEFDADSILVTVFDQWGMMMDKTRVIQDRAVDVIESHWDFQN